MKGLRYEHISDKVHRIYIDHKTLSLSSLQEERLLDVLKDSVVKDSIQCMTQALEKEVPRLTALDFSSKASAHHLLLLLETELAGFAHRAVGREKTTKERADALRVFARTMGPARVDVRVEKNEGGLLEILKAEGLRSPVRV